MEYKEKIINRHKIFINETIRLNNITTLFGGMEYNVIETINNSGSYGFTFNDGRLILGKCNKERFLNEYKNMFIFI
jgi:hypothetical protein